MHWLFYVATDSTGYLLKVGTSDYINRSDVLGSKSVFGFCNYFIVLEFIFSKTKVINFYFREETLNFLVRLVWHASWPYVFWRGSTAYCTNVRENSPTGRRLAAWRKWTGWADLKPKIICFRMVPKQIGFTTNSNCSYAYTMNLFSVLRNSIYRMAFIFRSSPHGSWKAININV